MTTSLEASLERESSLTSFQRDLPSSNQPEWKEVLSGEREKSYFKNLLSMIEDARSSGKIVYPQNTDVFNALSFTPFSKARVVILGQDPYHGPNQAHGLCFSVQKGVKPPPSLVNIFKELHSDLSIPIPSHGFLESWARQGVVLLNSVLTVEAGSPGSHANKGWETFTDRVIRELNERKEHLVFMLWGAYAQKKGAFIDAQKHLVLSAAHPSPFSAHSGFFGCKHFSKANRYLEEHGQAPIDWTLP
jgi:uracil-DNA glycosylase